MTIIKSKKGFTLIELMIVVAIIGILAAIAIPQFANLVAKSQEGATKGNLGTLRSALSIYYGDTEGVYPTDNFVNSLQLNAKYVQSVPIASLPKTNNNGGHANVPTVTAVATVAALAADTGGWNYDNNSTDQGWGQIVVACLHQDLRGSRWTAY